MDSIPIPLMSVVQVLQRMESIAIHFMCLDITANGLHTDSLDVFSSGFTEKGIHSDSLYVLRHHSQWTPYRFP